MELVISLDDLANKYQGKVGNENTTTIKSATFKVVKYILSNTTTPDSPCLDCIPDGSDCYGQYESCCDGNHDCVPND